MSNQKNYTPDEGLHQLSKDELVGKVITARQYFRQQETPLAEIESKIKMLESEIEAQDDTIEGLQAEIQDRNAEIDELKSLLQSICDLAQADKKG